MTSDSWPLKPYLPDKANLFCFRLWEKYRFHIRVSPPRKTKLGDYRFRPNQQKHLISINGDLNPYAFLVVYLHEVAHCLTSIKHGARVKPHGAHWQREMKLLITPLMSSDVFPGDVLDALWSYLKAPKAASCSHPELTRALRKYDPPNSKVALEQLEEGSQFQLRSRKYRKGTLKRTRVVCYETGNHRTWLIPKMALVDPVFN